MGGVVGWRKQGGYKAGDAEMSAGQPLLSAHPLPKRSASESCFPGLLPTRAADDDAFGRAPQQPPPLKSRCRQFWTAPLLTICLAFLGGIAVSYLAFTFSLGVSQTTGSFVKATQPAVKCQRPLPGNLPGPAVVNSTGNLTFSVPDRLIVAARHSEDTSWLDVYLSDIPHVVYQVDDPEHTVGAQHATLVNKGNEAMAYLQFIIDYYDRLPASIAFVHGHRSGWHMLDVVPVLQRLRWGRPGFAPLRYKNSPGDRLDWKCGSRTDDPVFKQFSCDWEGAALRPGNFSLRDAADVNEVSKDLWIDSLEISQVWPQAFEAELGPLPAGMQSPCCSSFLVSRDRIRARPRAFYTHLRDWIIRTEMNSYRSGRMMEYTWHMMFGEAPVLAALPECELLYCEADEA